MASTRVELVTPSGVLFSGSAEMVVCRTEGGDIAFLADHMAYVGNLEAYPLRIVRPEASREGGTTGTVAVASSGATSTELHFDVQGGFVEVNDNRVVVLCDAAKPAEPQSSVPAV